MQNKKQDKKQYFIKATVTEVREACIHIKGVKGKLFEDQESENLWNIYEPIEQEKSDWPPILKEAEAEILLPRSKRTTMQMILSEAFIQQTALIFTVEIENDKISLISVAHDKD